MSAINVVSVPLRGKYRSEVVARLQLEEGSIATFPSPCGVNIVAKDEAFARAYFKSNKEFPSPCGVNIVAKLIKWKLWLRSKLRFPSPCRVNIVAKLAKAKKEIFYYSKVFPSPCGVNIVAKSNCNCLTS